MNEKQFKQVKKDLDNYVEELSRSNNEIYRILENVFDLGYKLGEQDGIKKTGQ